MIIIKPNNLLNCDILHDKDEMYHLDHNTTNNIKNIEFIINIIL